MGDTAILDWYYCVMHLSFPFFQENNFKEKKKKTFSVLENQSTFQSDDFLKRILQLD